MKCLQEIRLPHDTEDRQTETQTERQTEGQTDRRYGLLLINRDSHPPSLPLSFLPPFFPLTFRIYLPPYILLLSTSFTFFFPHLPHFPFFPYTFSSLRPSFHLFLYPTLSLSLFLYRSLPYPSLPPSLSLHSIDILNLSLSRLSKYTFPDRSQTQTWENK